MIINVIKKKIFKLVLCYYLNFIVYTVLVYVLRINDKIRYYCN